MGASRQAIGPFPARRPRVIKGQALWTRRSEFTLCDCGDDYSKREGPGPATGGNRESGGHPGLWNKEKSLLCFAVPFPPHTHTPVRDAVLLRRAARRGPGRDEACYVLFIRWDFTLFCKSMCRGGGRERRPRPLPHYVRGGTILSVVSNKTHRTKQKVMYVYEKINCTISFQHILLYILVPFTFSSLLIRGCELYSFQLVPHIRELKKEYRRNRENICELQVSKKKIA